MKFFGAFTALITPFKDNDIDLNSLEKLINFQLSNGINGLVPVGSTGESVCLSDEEHYQIVDTTVGVVSKEVPVIAGVSSNDTSRAIKLAKQAAQADVDAVMAVVPFYNRPPARGIIAHFKAIANSIDIPLLLYNVPSRTAIDMNIEIIKELAKTPNIFGIKDASGDLNRVKLYKEAMGEKFVQFCGEDNLVADYYSLGGNGSISVIANIIPNIWSEIYQLSVSSKQKSKSLLEKYMPLIKALSCDVNPIPIKYAVHKIGLCKEEYRLPLLPLANENKHIIDEQLNKLGLI